MSSTKDGDSKEPRILHLVGGNQHTGEATLPDGVDKATFQKLGDLKKEHRELDEEIFTLTSSVAVDQLLLKRLKKKKLMLKDLITRVEDSMLPDIIA